LDQLIGFSPLRSELPSPLPGVSALGRPDGAAASARPLSAETVLNDMAKPVEACRAANKGCQPTSPFAQLPRTRAEATLEST